MKKKRRKSTISYGKRILAMMLAVLMFVSMPDFLFDTTVSYAGNAWTISTATLSVGATLSNNYIYIVTANRTITASAGGNGLAVASGATVVLYIKEGVTLTVTGGAASGTTGGGAGIYVPSNATLIITGGGTLKATGGAAAGGSSGGSGGTGGFSESPDRYWAGTGGYGGRGGGGAGAGIGTKGGTGGGQTGTTSGSATSTTHSAPDGNSPDSRLSGTSGTYNSGSGSSASGKIYILGTTTVTATGGSASSSYGSGGSAGSPVTDSAVGGWSMDWTAGAGGGGGGGGSGYGAANIGSGGGGAGSGGSGGTGGCYTSKSAYYYLNGGGGGGGAGYSSGFGGYRYGNTRTTSPTTQGSYSGGSGGSGGSSGSSGSGGTLYVASTATLTNAAAKYSSTTNNGKGATTTKGTSAAEITIPTSVTYSLTYVNREMAEDSQTATQTVTLGCTFSGENSADIPSKTGYEFRGYYTKEAGAGIKVLDENGDVIPSVSGYTDENGVWLGTSNTTLYAWYERQSYDTILKPESDFTVKEWNEINSQLFYLSDYSIQTGSMEPGDTWAPMSGSYEGDSLISAKFVCTTEGKTTQLRVRLQDNQPMDGVTISVWQILDITGVAEDGKYSYALADEKLRPFFCEWMGQESVTDGEIVCAIGNLETSQKKMEFANALKRYIDANAVTTFSLSEESGSIEPISSETGNEEDYSVDLDISRQYYYEMVDGTMENDIQTFSGGLGYYLITRSDAVDDTYTLAMIDEPNTELVLKGSALSIHKSGNQVVMKVGDRVTYTLESKIVNTGGDMDFVYVIYDWLEDTMEADMNSFQVYVLDDSGNKKLLVKEADYVLKNTTLNMEDEMESREVIAITFLFDENSALYQDACVGNVVLVNYEAEMTETATMGTKAGRENHNSAWIEYGKPGDTEKTTEKVWDVYAIGLLIHKTDESGTPLNGAEFVMYDAKDIQKSNPLRFSKHPDGYYYYDNTNGVSVLVTDVNGNIDIHGLNDRSFVLKESKPPAGYQAVDAQVVTVTVDENVQTDRFLDLMAETDADTLTRIKTDLEEGYITLTIKDPTEGSHDLPATGGKGRILVYVLGSFILASGGAAFVISRKRR